MYDVGTVSLIKKINNNRNTYDMKQPVNYVEQNNPFTI